MIVKKALKTPLMFNESSNMKLRVNNQKDIKTFQILWAILILGLVILMAVYFMRVDSITVPKGEEAVVSIYKEVEEEERLYGDLPGTTVIEEDTSRSNDSCSFELVENVPYDLAFEINSTAAKPLYRAWMRLLDMAQEKIHVASYYWSLTGKDIGVNDSSSKQGEDILKRFERLLAENVSLYVAASVPTLATNSTDLEFLEEKGANVKKIDFGHLAGGVLHSKFWIVDMKHIYIGSANMDWRSLSQVKEFGAVIYNCSCLAKDLWKTFSTYWDLGYANATVPFPWPFNYSTHINKHQPLEVEFNGILTKTYFSASPPAFCPEGRTYDLFAITNIISEAQEFVYVSVMEYFPTSRFVHPQRYWPAIDNALRCAAFNHRVQIRLLVSCWTHSDAAMLYYLRSLRALNNPHAHISVDVKLFIVPVLNHTNIPHGRVNHNKYMVTDKVAYIGTSNWSEDYFVSTAGVGLIIKQNSTNPQRRQLPIQEQLKNLFERDWNSKYAAPEEMSLVAACGVCICVHALYWPAIDNALRCAAFNHRVQIRLLVSCWTHSDAAMLYYLRSLRALNNPHAHISVDVKLFIVPVLNHTNIPHGRVNHNKYMVTDKVAYIGTSNWSEDYFVSTAGVGLIIKQNSTNPQRRQLPIQEQLKNLFERDWNSKYAVSLEDVQGQKDCNWRCRV